MRSRQYFTAGITDAPSGLITQYQSIGGVGQVGQWENANTNVKYIVPTPGKWTNLYLKQDSANGVGATRAYQMYKETGGVASAGGTAISISGSSQVYGTNFSTMSTALYDYVYIGTTPTGSPSGQGSRWSIEFIPDNPKKRVFLANSGGTSVTSATRYFSVAGQSPISTLETDIQVPVCSLNGGKFGTITDFVVGLSATPGAVTASRTLRLRVNGSTVLTVTITGTTATTGITSGTVDMNDGDLLSIESIGTNSPTACTIYFGIVYEPVVIFEQQLSGSATDPLRTTAGNEYDYPSTGDSNWSNTLSERYVLSKAGHFYRAQRSRVTNAPGASKERVFTLYDGDDNLITGITGTATTDISDPKYQQFGLYPTDLTERHLCVFASTVAGKGSWGYQVRNLSPFGVFGCGFGM